MERLRRLSEENLSNNFLFGCVMIDEEICCGVLQLIFPELNIKKVNVVQTEKGIKDIFGAHGIRMDVYAEGETGNVYNMEMQTTDKKDIAHRARFNQSLIDMHIFPEGTPNYNKLPDVYIIFICTFDIFGQNRSIYRFCNREETDNKLTLNDGTVKIILNTEGTDSVNKDLKYFLEYVEDSTPEIVEESGLPLLKKISDRVTKIKNNSEMEDMYMTFQRKMFELQEEARMTGWEEGIEQGREEGIRQGIEQGIEQGHEEERKKIIIELLEDLGAVSGSLKNKINEQQDFKVLKKWVKLCIKIKSVEEFEKQMNE